MVTIIVPTYNEEENIKKFQNNLSKLEGDFEIIFSDGFSTDRTYDLIKYKKIRQAKYRSNQMNEAVKYAQGDILWFLHADSMVDPLSIKKIEESDLDAVGCFKLKFDKKNLLLKMIEIGSNLRVDIRKIAFGDQGIFIKKSLFERLGGYKPIPLMEDYEFSIMLKENDIAIKRLNTPITTSSRRYMKNGILKTNRMMHKLQKTYRKARKKGYVNKIIDDIYNVYEQKE